MSFTNRLKLFFIVLVINSYASVSATVLSVVLGDNPFNGTNNTLTTNPDITEDSPQPTFRILPMGDSLIVGNGVPGGFRKSLFYKLKKKGYNVDYIGSSRENNSSKLSDDEHEGHPGWTCSKMKEYSRELLENVPDPDVIVLIIGGEDMMAAENHAGYENVIHEWNDLIVHIASIRPHAQIVVSTLIPKKNNPTFNTRIEKYFNPFVQSSVSKHREQGRKLAFIDLASEMKSSDLSDSGYPNRKGYKTIGQKLANSIHRFIKPYGDSNPPQLIRTEGSLDRQHVVLTFSKPIREDSVNKENFKLNYGRLELVDAVLDKEQRKITLTTTQKYAHGIMHKLFITGEIVDQTEAKNVLEVDSGTPITFQSGFRFLVLSDWHSAEKYVLSELNPWAKEGINQDIKNVQYLSDRYGGEFIMIPGDTNAGQWGRFDLKTKLSKLSGENLTKKETVLEAGKRCYGGMLNSFRLGGYSKILLSHGDHEAGDNPWKVGDFKSLAQPEFRKALGDSFNSDYNGVSRYDGTIGNIPARPLGDYSDTAFATVHKNILIVTVDPFYQESPFEKISEAGTVAMRITGEQLEWLDLVLEEGRKLPEVKHVFVQAHVPVLHPVKKSRSSGQMMEGEERSEFWKTLQRHKVDIYFTGEVHLNTVTQDKDSKLIQIASRGNYFNNFLTVDVSDDQIEIRCRNEIGNEQIRYNLDYQTSGRLVIKKNSDGSTRKVEGTGQLTPIDPMASLIHFDFEEKLPLESRSILGLGLIPGVPIYKPFLKSVPVNGVECAEALPNKGEFGSDYDAQSANIHLTTEDGMSGRAGAFQSNSRAGIWAMGPHFEDREVSYSLWIKTKAKDMPILISYEGYWIKPEIMNLRLRNGRPEVAVSSTQKLKAQDDSLRLNNDQWHHIVVSVTIDDGRLSDMKLYVDGINVKTVVEGKDSKITFPNGGVVSLGGFGHGRSSNAERQNDRHDFENGDPYVGLMDEVQIYARGLSHDDVLGLYLKHRSFAPTASPSRSSAPSADRSTHVSYSPTVSSSRNVTATTMNNFSSGDDRQ